MFFKWGKKDKTDKGQQPPNDKSKPNKTDSKDKTTASKAKPIDQRPQTEVAKTTEFTVNSKIM